MADLETLDRYPRGSRYSGVQTPQSATKTATVVAALDACNGIGSTGIDGTDTEGSAEAVTIIRERPVHGGAWKVAYADFVTAMMAFFMLLWLLNVAPPETLAGLADYFSPTTAAVVGRSGQREINPASDADGLNPSPIVAISRPGPPPSGPAEGEKSGSESDNEGEPSLEEVQVATAREDESFEELQEQLRLAIQESAELQDNQDQIVFEITEDGLKIQLLDKDQRSMFRSGSDELYNYSRRLICSVGESVGSLPNRLDIEGHTDGGSLEGLDPGRKWDLSSGRANAARRVLSDCGVSNDRFAQVIGKADTDPLYPDNRSRIENRRITILVVREAPVVPPKL